MENKSKAVDVFGLGHCCVDHLCLFDKYPDKGKKGDVTASITAAGGPVPTALTLLSRYGLTTVYAGIVGSDSNGEFILQSLEQAGVDTSLCLRDSDIQTPCANIWIDRKDGARTIALDITAHRWLLPGEVNLSIIDNCRLFLSDCRATELNLQALQRAKSNGVTTVIDVGSHREKFEVMLTYVDYAVVSLDLADVYLPGADERDLADWMLSNGAGCAVVTCGERGAFVMNLQLAELVPGFKVEAVDTTGAGDIFHGAFVYKLLEGSELLESVRFANAASALSCTKLSGVAGIFSLRELREFINQG